MSSAVGEPALERAAFEDISLFAISRFKDSSAEFRNLVPPLLKDLWCAQPMPEFIKMYIEGQPKVADIDNTVLIAFKKELLKSVGVAKQKELIALTKHISQGGSKAEGESLMTLVSKYDCLSKRFGFLFSSDHSARHDAFFQYIMHKQHLTTDRLVIACSSLTREIVDTTGSIECILAAITHLEDVISTSGKVVDEIHELIADGRRVLSERRGEK